MSTKRRYLPALVLCITLSLACRILSPFGTQAPESSPTIAAASLSQSPAIPPTTELPPPTLAQVPTIIIPDGVPIEPYQDVRGLNFSAYNVDLDRSLIETLWFNGTTKWPGQSGDVAQDILELGKNPGLGIRAIHAQGITGEGVNVAIIDQNMVVDHPEFQGKIVEYFDVGTDMPSTLGSMHGPAVTSLLVGENIGTAPDANVYYVAAPSWKADAQYFADALNWIIDENEKLPDDQKIRVVSVSAAPSGPGSPFTVNNAAWDIAYERAIEAGILVLDCTEDHGIAAPCHYDLDDPENVAKCIPGWPGIETQPMPDRIYIPTSLRTSAEEYDQGNYSYQYTGRGGLSWAIPYLSGVLALGWQVRPDLTGEQLLEILYGSAYVTDGGLKIINPGAFIDMVRLAGSQ